MQTTVQVSKETRSRIKNKQRKGESVNLTLLKLLDKYGGLLD